jgi:hypothetical protein
MITWKETESGGFTATCGEYKLVVYIWHPTEVYEGAFYRDNIRIGETGDKPTVDDAKNTLMTIVFDQIKKDVTAQAKTIAEFWDLKRSMDRDILCTDEKPETRTVRALIDGGYTQVSSKYHLLARLPPGKTALEALEDECPKYAAQVRDQCENLARSHYLRMSSQKGNHVTLTIEEFAEFKRLKGDVA